MRIFAIKDDTMPQDYILGYLIYYDIPKSWYKSEPKPEPKRVNTPIGDPCSGGGFGRSSC